jgi:glucan phosphoethanolaminetransferase (alkaline phosphatase superfamily)
MPQNKSQVTISQIPRGVLVVFGLHLAANVLLYIYINKRYPVFGFVYNAIKDHASFNSYVQILKLDIVSYGAIHYFVLHFCLLFSVAIAFALVMFVVCNFVGRNCYRTMFSFGFGCLFSLVYFILSYNVVMIKFLNKLVNKWDMYYFTTILKQFCESIGLNVFVLLFVVIIFWAAIIYMHWISFKCLDGYKYAVPANGFFEDLKLMKSPLSLALFAVFVANIAWAEPKILLCNEVLFSWMTDGPIDNSSWDFRTVLYSYDGESCIKSQQNNQVLLDESTVADSVYKMSGNLLPNIIIVVVDSLRADHLGFNGYVRDTTPFLSSLYYSGKIESATMATSTCSETMCGIGSLLLSKAYDKMSLGGVRLHKVLQSMGYNLQFYSSDIPNYKGLYLLYDDYSGTVYDIVSNGSHELFDDNIILDGLKVLRKADNTPNFFFFHIMSNHFMGKRVEAFQGHKYSAHIDSPGSIVNSSDKTSEAEKAYDNRVEQSDFIIKTIYNSLETNGYLKNSIFIIVGDHGEGLGERQLFLHNNFLYQEFINIPMIFIRSNQEKKLYLDYTTQIDLAPTIAELIGIKPPNAWEGKPLTEQYSQRVSFHQTIFSNPIRVTIEKNNNSILKYVENSGSCEAYDLIADHKERSPIKIDCSQIKQVQYKSNIVDLNLQ